MAPRVRVWVGAIVLLFAMAAAAAAEPRRVLFLHSFGRDFSPYSEFAAKLRAELARQSPEPIDIYQASLLTARFADDEREVPFIEYLNALFADRRLDLVVTIGGPAAGFVQKYRERIFPTTPALFTSVDERRLTTAALGVNDAVVAVRIDLPTLIANILTVRPQTTSVHVVIGNSPLERFWLGEMRREFAQFADRVEFTWFNDLSFEQMLSRSAALPPNSAIFFGPFSVDAAGVSQPEDKALVAIHAVANAPVFSYVDAHFGRGIVGGPLISLEEVGRRAAIAAVRILRGERPADVNTPSVGLAKPVFDVKELRHWGINEASLPAGSIVKFREQTVWDQHGWYIAAAIVLCTLEAILIVVLLVYGRRLRRAHAERRRAEDAAHELSGRLIHAQEEERSRLARELHDDVTQRLALLAIDAGRQERSLSNPADSSVTRTMREGLVRLSEDVHALSYRLHPAILEDLGLVEALKSECERFARGCPIRLEANAEDFPDKLPRDAALCLFRIAQEGLRNIARHAKASRAELCLQRLDGGLQLVIRDNGMGFDAAHPRTRLSLGHASMRQRVFFLGGKINIDSWPDHGTMIAAWVPLNGERSESSPRAAG